MIQSLLNMDSSVLLWVQQTFVNDALTPVMAMFTRMGNNGMIWIAIAGLLSLNKKTRKIGILCFVALAFAVLVDNVILKNIVARARPYDVISQVQLLIERQNDYSFPSGHAASSFAVATVLFLTFPNRYGIASLVLAGLIGFSRIYLGVHYPLDVLGGLVSGGIIGILVVKWNYLFREGSQIRSYR